MRLDLQVQAVGAVDRVRAQVEVLEHAERHQRDDALAVGRDLVQRVAAVVHLRAARPSRTCARRDRTRASRRRASSRAPRSSRRARRGRTPRPCVRAIFSSTSACSWKMKRSPGAGRATVRQERVSEPGLIPELGHLLFPLAGDRRRDQKPFAAVLDRALEQLLEGKSFRIALTARRQADTQPGTRHRCSSRAAASPCCPAKYSGVQRCGRAAGSVEAVELLAVPDDGIGVGADAVRYRLDQRQRDRGGEDRVDRAAAGGEHLQAGLRGERLRGRDHVRREQRLARPRSRDWPRRRAEIETRCSMARV